MLANISSGFSSLFQSVKAIGIKWASANEAIFGTFRFHLSRILYIALQHYTSLFNLVSIWADFFESLLVF
jgi:hypothetical protein